MADANISLAGGRILARQCQAKCKATQQQCRCPAVRGYRVCRVHGARGGPSTSGGRARCAAAKLIHGTETRAIRAKAAQSTKRIRAARFAIGLLDSDQVDQLSRETIAALIREMIDD
jgi:hypothetical protein